MSRAYFPVTESLELPSASVAQPSIMLRAKLSSATNNDRATVDRSIITDAGGARSRPTGCATAQSPTAWAGRLLALTLATFLAGCSSLELSKSPKWPWQKEPTKVELPDRIMPIWSDTVLYQPGEAGLRGFGGRLFFFKDKNTDPVVVDGSLTVYVFDADSVDPGNPAPLKKYVYTPEQFEDLMSRSTLGPSYSVWIPWDEVGGEARRLSLVARYEGRSGGVVLSEPSIKMLPGVSKKTRVTAGSDGRLQPVPQSGVDGAVQLAGFNTFGETTDTGSVKRRASQTIDLPPSFANRLKNSAASDAQTVAASQAAVPDAFRQPQASGGGPSHDSGAPATTPSTGPSRTGDGGSGYDQQAKERQPGGLQRRINPVRRAGSIRPLPETPRQLPRQ
jgi:hypothetical protein